MSAEKQSVITSCVFQKDWQHPGGGTLYYHNIEFKNGEAGVIGAAEKNPAKLAEGLEIKYSIDSAGKVKYIEAVTTVPNQSPSKQGSGNGTTKPNNAGNNTKQKGWTAQKKEYQPADYLGYAWSYAKDLVIAGKTMEDVEEMDKIANYIYGRVGQMLNGEIMKVELPKKKFGRQPTKKQS